MQFGFLSKRSTIDALAGITERIRQRSTDTFTCFLFGLRKAIDSMTHENLLAKLLKDSVGEKCLNWSEFFSKKQRQCDQVKDLLPEFLYLLAGVQQG